LCPGPPTNEGVAQVCPYLESGADCSNCNRPSAQDRRLPKTRKVFIHHAGRWGVAATRPEERPIFYCPCNQEIRFRIAKEQGSKWGFKLISKGNSPQCKCGFPISKDAIESRISEFIKGKKWKNIEDFLAYWFEWGGRRRLAQREFSDRRDSPDLLRLLEEIEKAQP